MNRLRLVKVFATICCSVAIGGAQVPVGDPVPKDAPALLEASRAAVQATTTMSMHCKHVQKLGEGLEQEAAADVVYRRGDSGPAFLYMKGKVTKPESFAFEALLVDGQFIVVDTAKKTFESWTWIFKDKSDEEMLSELSKRSLGYDLVRSVFPEMHLSLGINIFEAEGATEKTAALKGVETIGGVLCDVVEIRFTLESFSADEETAKLGIKIPPMTHVHRHAIGRGDLLPRRWTWQVPEFMGSAGPAEIHELTKLKTEAPTGADPALVMDGLKEGRVGSGKSSPRGPGGKLPGGGGPGGGTKIILGPSVGEAAPAFAVKDTAGKEYSLQSLKGKSLLIHFGKLDDSLDDEILTGFKKRHGDKLIVLDLVVGGDAAEIKKAKKALNFPRGVGGAAVAADWRLEIFPSTFFVGPDGSIAGKLPSGLRGGAGKLMLEDFHKRTAQWLKDPKKILGE